MTALDFAIYPAAGVAAVGFFFLLKFAARTFGAVHAQAARAAFAGLDRFTPAEILVYLNSAIAFDPQQRRIAIWEKRSGARLVGNSSVGAWLSGAVHSDVGDHTVVTPMVHLYAKPDDPVPFFKVGVLEAGDCIVWRDHLSRAFGAAKGRDAVGAKPT